MSKKSALTKISLVYEPAEYFREEIQKAIHKQKLDVEKETEFYLVDLLKRFMISKNFFKVDEQGALEEPTLALMLAEALSAVDKGRKCEDLRKLGDTALYTAGFFSDRLNTKLVDSDYYISMGANAYSTLTQLMIDAHFQKVFSDLSKRFVKFVDVLSELSAASFMQDTKNVLRIYDQWLKTGSEKMESQLKDAGILPMKKCSVQ